MQYTNQMAVATTANYGASKTSSTAEAVAATYPSNPNDLAVGAIGFYAETVMSGVSGNRLLIKVGGSPSLGEVDADNSAILPSTVINVYQGTLTGAVKIGQFQAGDLVKATKRNYLAPIKGYTYIGYNGTTGSLNLPTILLNDEAVVMLTERYDAVGHVEDRKNYNAVLTAGEVAYSILNKLCKTINNDTGAPVVRKSNAEITGSGTVADWTGDGTALRFTKGSKVVEFMIGGTDAGYVASTGTVSIGNIISVPHYNIRSVTFTANILGTAAGRHVIYIGNTMYNVADAGSAAQNATAIAAAINAGTQATATVSTADVTITLTKSTTTDAKIFVAYTPDDVAGNYTVLTLTVNSTSGDTNNTLYKAGTAATAAASFELDRIYTGESMIALGGTTVAIHTGIYTLTVNTEGLRITDLENFKSISASVDSNSVLGNATVTRVGARTGSGAGELVTELENSWKSRKTMIAREEPILQKGETYAVSTTNYDMIEFEYKPTPLTYSVAVNTARLMTVVAPTGGSSDEVLSYLEDFFTGTNSKLLTAFVSS